MLLLSGSHSCSSLIQFKNSFSIAKDASWYCNDFAGLKSYPKTNSWKEGTDCCSWDGVTCDHLNAHVIALDLSCSWLYGNFPSNTTLFLLPHLQKLNLAYNDFNLSKIPSEFDRRHLFLDEINISSVNVHVFMNLSSSLRSLSLAGCVLYFSSCDLSEFPQILKGLKSLESLDLSCNRIEGKIPQRMKEVGNDSLTNYLNVSHNSLTEVEHFPWKNIISLDLSSNLIRGNLPIPASNISVFFISNNSFNGEVSSLICNATSLQILDLSHNNLSGTIPQRFGNLSNNLQFFNLKKNKFYGTIPPTFANGCQLSNFNLNGNLLEGPLTPSILIVKAIINSFNGEVSSLICNASFLRILDLSHNNLSGTIPPCFGSLSDSLEFLNLMKNKFYGTIPPTFAKGCNLSNFNLNGNLLEGPLTPSIFNCKGLEVLDLSNNKINDTFPHWLGSLPQLQVLVLKSNHMHGSLCVNSSKSSPFFSKIQIFDLSSNYFSGPLPVGYINNFKAIINLEKIGSTVSYMGVYGGRDCGFYMYSIGIVMKGQYMELVKIFTMWMIIDLSNNQFEGEIPKVFGKLNLLKGLNLSHNNLNGGIPTSIGNLTSLEWLDLSSNRLSGMIQLDW
ncbi:receptor-like protein Cf-9 homolog [Gossypium hirsutum]|uniref:Receptor-like protein Cf-9 homolog n=1 Tax=Gossypium hirsutum TaxID=3635 RepID=A0ABM3BIQ3_GOSHI|nr:receptor-like protein Cf-9 homolog [Gossypium hirsutum]